MGIAGWLNGADSAARVRPNVVFIMADDLGYGDLASYGNPTIQTPNLDRMAAEGMQFMQFYCASSLCSPSRAALITGRLPVRFGLNAVLPPVTRRGLPAEELSLGELMQSAGYVTACIGKWHLGRKRQYLPPLNGFDYFFGLPYSNDMSRKNNSSAFIYDFRVVPPLPLMRGLEIIETEPEQALLTGRYTEEAIEFIKKAAEQDKPFFLYLPHTFPHIPLAASDRFRGKSARGLYGDTVEELDWSTGEILRTLSELGLDENTIVFFTSDNGPWLSKKDGGGSAGPLREGKGSTWDGGLRVPLIARWPGQIPANVRTQAFATMMDVFPTFASLAGAEVPDDRIYDGVDISDILFENAAGVEPLLYLWVRQELRAVRSGPWKLHAISNAPENGTRKTVRNSPPLLFHILRDPGEKYDVAADHPEVVNRILEMMSEHRKSIRNQ
jgi:arylsulfatase A